MNDQNNLIFGVAAVIAMGFIYLLMQFIKNRTGRDAVPHVAHVIAVKQRPIMLFEIGKGPTRNLSLEILLTYTLGTDIYNKQVLIHARNFTNNQMPQVLLDTSDGGTPGGLIQRAREAKDLRKKMLEQGRTEKDVAQALLELYPGHTPEEEARLSYVSGPTTNWNLLDRPLDLPILLNRTKPHLMSINYKQF